jgi:acetyltransferase-like isoleucine patch superfamily enzyme
MDEKERRCVAGKVKISDEGQDNTITVPEDFRGSLKVTVTGSRCRVDIAPTPLLEMRVTLAGDDTVLSIGKNTTATDVRINMHEAGRITIGRDCMFSGNIWISNSDVHSIVDLRTGKRLNHAEDVVIGDHVWLGRNVVVTKGSHIGSGSIIGAGAVVSGRIAPNSLAVGVPARVIRRDVTWDRLRLAPGEQSRHRGRGGKARRFLRWWR